MTPDKKINGPARSKTLLRQRTVNDFTDAMDWAQARIANNPELSKGASARGTRSFCATEDLAEYQTMMREGWREGIEGVEGLDGLSTDMSEKITFVRNVGGAFPVVPAYLSGAPNAMLQPVPQAVDSVRGLTLVVNSSFHCGVDARDCLKYAHSVMRLLAWLQSEGIETAVYSVISMQHSTGRMLYTCPIREAGDVMQPERIASIVHPSWLRRAWFALVEREFHEFGLPYTNMCNSGYGYPQTATTEELQQALPETYSVILLPGVGSGDPEKAVRDAYTLKLKLQE